jgi:hypothetical protein
MRPHSALDRLAGYAFGFVALLLLASACAHQGEPFVPIRPSVPESTLVEGPQEGRWTRKKSPYYVVKSILVVRNRTLTIEPGVSIVFTKKGLNLNVEGKLLAVGKPESLITFRATIPAGGVANPGDWGSVFLTGTGHRVNHVRFLHSTTPLQVTDGEVTVENTTLSNALSHGITAHRSSLTLRNCTIANNGAHGIDLDFCEDPINSVLIDHCNIGFNAFAGIWSSFSTALIVRSDIKNNGGSCQGGEDEEQMVCAGAHFEGTPGVQLPFFRMCNLENNIPVDIRNMMVSDLTVSADSTWWGSATTWNMDNLSTPDPQVPPDKRNCFFNLPNFYDGYDTQSQQYVRFCYWRDAPWPNFSSSAPSSISWGAPSPRLGS